MRHALAGLVLFAAGAALGTWLAGRAAIPEGAGAKDAPSRYALQAWEGCRPLEAGDAFEGPVTRTLALSDGRSLQVSMVPVTRDNGTRVFDTLVKVGGSSSRSQTGFQSPLLADGVLMRPVDLDAVSREVSGGAEYVHAPHPMAQ